MAHSLIGKHEAEIKHRISDPDEAIERIHRLGAVPRFIRNIEHDVCFDLPDGRLSAKGKHLLLRRRVPYEEVLLILKDRREQTIEVVAVNSYDTAMRLLKGCGFVETLRVKKTRSMFLRDHFHIVVDTIDGHGHFIEIGSMTDDLDELAPLEAEAVKLLRLLGYGDSEREYRSYHDFV